MPTINPAKSNPIAWVTENLCMGRIRICRKWEGSDVRWKWLGRATIDVCSTSRYDKRRILERWAKWTHPWSGYRRRKTKAPANSWNLRIRPWTDGRHRHQLEPFERSRKERWNTLLESFYDFVKGRWASGACLGALRDVYRLGNYSWTHLFLAQWTAEFRKWEAHMSGRKELRTMPNWTEYQRAIHIIVKT